MCWVAGVDGTQPICITAINVGINGANKVGSQSLQTARCHSLCPRPQVLHSLGPWRLPAQTGAWKAKLQQLVSRRGHKLVAR